MSAPAENIAAVVPTAKAQVTVTTRPIPVPGPGEILVRTRAVAVNPADWKIQEYSFAVSKYPAVLGSDVAGEVVSAGPSTTGLFRPGDRVLGFAATIYKDDADHGAFQTYALLPELATARIPDAVSFEQASVFPMAWATAGVALFDELGLPREPVVSKDESKKKRAVLVWGASGSVGATAVQMAHERGYAVYGTASARHHGWLKELGAARLFDHADADVVQKITAAAGADGFALDVAFDTIAEGDTIAKTTAAVAPFAPAKVAIVQALPEGVVPPPGVTANWIKAWDHATEKPDLGRWLFNDWLTKALQDGSIVPAPKVQIVEGGLAATQKAWDMSKKGVSGVKLVVKVD